MEALLLTTSVVAPQLRPRCQPYRYQRVIAAEQFAPPSEFEGTVAAIQASGVYTQTDKSYRVTAADVAASQGCSLSTASSTLRNLAVEAGGAMEVTSKGNVLFAFPRASLRANRRGHRLDLQWTPRLAVRHGSGRGRRVGPNAFCHLPTTALVGRLSGSAAVQ